MVTSSRDIYYTLTFMGTIWLLHLLETIKNKAQRTNAIEKIIIKLFWFVLSMTHIRKISEIISSYDDSF